MESGFLILLRYFLRIDLVLFLLKETRIFHAFHSPPAPRPIQVRIIETLESIKYHESSESDGKFWWMMN